MNKWILTIGILIIGIFAWKFLPNETANTIPSKNSTTQINESNIKIIAFGDSLTAGYGLSQSESFPAQLEAALIAKGHNVSVINAGVSGETTRGNLERASFIASQNPDIVLLGIGGNDALRALPLSEIKKNMSETIAILQDNEKVPVILLLQMQAPLNAGLSYKNEFDRIYTDIAKENSLILVPFITADIFLDRNNKLSDGIHYNQLGYSKVVEQYVLPATEKVLDNL